MSTPDAPFPEVNRAFQSPWWKWLAPCLLVLAAVTAYHNTFSAPFIFDDIPAITQNASIRDLGRPSELLAPPALRGSSAGGRPLVNLSLALNRSLDGEEVWGYHAFNLLVHIGAGLVLFGLVRRIARLFWASSSSGTGTSDPEWVAFLISLIWLVHPLLTESVTCIVQRTESMAGFFYLATFYGFVRSVEGRGSRGWKAMCGLACLLGALTKEIMVTAPVLLWLFDRTFVAGTFRETWVKRGRFYLGLALSTWLVVGLLVWRSETRGGTVGFGQGVSSWEYLLTQCQALVLYLKLSIWPHPLVLDYGTDLVREARVVWREGLVILTLLIGTAWALWRKPVAGFFLGVVFRHPRAEFECGSYHHSDDG